MKPNNKKIVGFIFLISILIVSCDFIDNKLTFKNLTKDSIAIVINGMSNQFPTSISMDSVPNEKISENLLLSKPKYDPLNTSGKGIYFLLKDTIITAYVFNHHWENEIDRMPGKKLELYFFDASILTSGKFTWKEILCNKMYKEKKIYTKEDLQNSNWIICYGK